MDATALTELINTAVETLSSDLKEDDRMALLTSCNKLKASLESPVETTLRIMLGAYEATTLRLAIDMKILELAFNPKKPISAKELATDSSADPLLVARLMRMLAGMGFFVETGVDEYTAKPMVAAYLPGSPLRECAIHLSSIVPAVSKLPDYFGEKGYQNPGDAFDGPWQYAHQTDKHFFDWLSERPVLQNAFNVTMGISRTGRGEEWFDFYPVEEKLQKLPSGSDILLVDIGGGVGHDLISFRNKFPSLPGKLILEDLASVVAKAKDLPKGLETVGHDFFQPQPSTIRNAKAYYLRTVLHDWPDKQARTILEGIRDVMSSESVLLINENVMPATNSTLQHAQMDMAMMTCFSALDRTERQFEELLNSIGFQLVKIWKPTAMIPGVGTLFEAVLKS